MMLLAKSKQVRPWFFFVVVLLSPLSVVAQEQYITVRDFETWSALQVEAKISKRAEICAVQQLRFNDNSSALQQSFSQLSAQYKWKNDWFLGGALRFASVAKDSVFQPRLRWNVDAGYGHEVGRFDFGYRLRYQSRSIVNDLSALPSNVARAKVKMRYNVRDWKLDPSFAVELFSQTDDLTKPNKLRGTLSTSYKLSKSTNLSAFYRVETELFEVYPLTSYIVGARLKYSFKTY